MVEAKFFLELLVRLFADPARLDRTGRFLDGNVCGQVREIVFTFAVGTMLAYQSCLLTGMCCAPQGADALWRTVSDTHANGGKARDEN